MPNRKDLPAASRWARRLRNRHMALVDALLIALAALVSFDLRLEVLVPWRYLEGLALYLILSLCLRLALMRALGMYRRYWQYAGADDFLELAGAISLSSALLSGLYLLLLLPARLGGSFPRSVLLIDWGVCLLLLGGLRFIVRSLASGSLRLRGGRRDMGERVIVAGAGEAGLMIAREMQTNPRSGLHMMGFVDDDPGKTGRLVHGLPVLGTCADLDWLVRKHRVGRVIVAMPSAPGATVRAIREMVSQDGVKVFVMPRLSDLFTGQVGVNMLREVQIEDLLRREAVETDLAAVRGGLQGRRVLVTGAGGSIGSELCRQILSSQPALLVLVGHGENSIFDISQELRRSDSATVIQSFIADVRDPQRLAAIFARCRPEVVYHAAAHKHVPLMEENPIEAVTNNIFGTRNVAAAAEAHGVQRLVMISTDKAVCPASIMGCSKRLAEMVVLEAADRTGRAYAAVRFGNVLNSRGSVIPLFQRQISSGGPVTVTHAEMTRYFMTIPEAVQLVLQAAALARGGEVFVLDMGEPVKIVDLATDLIRLSGLTPLEDIQIEYTGVRPGEKLHEVLHYPDEALQGTAHIKIKMIMNGRGQRVDPLPTLLRRLEEMVVEGKEEELREQLWAVMAASNGEGSAMAPQQAEAVLVDGRAAADG
jgi:FlaA1/EpsC-like NDP-sugar epimerase